MQLASGMASGMATDMGLLRICSLYVCLGLRKTNMNFKVLESKKILKNNFHSLYNFILRKKLDLEKIYTLTALIFLNMSPLHHSPFDKILFGLSKELLSDKNYLKKYEPN